MVRNLIGSSVREVRTRGDGACALHAAFAILETSDALAVASPRRSLRATLGHPLETARTRARGAHQHLVQTVLTALWEFALLYGANTDAARNEEALFLSHLRRSRDWDRVVEATVFHRERQADVFCFASVVCSRDGRRHPRSSTTEMNSSDRRETRGERRETREERRERREETRHKREASRGRQGRSR